MPHEGDGKTAKAPDLIWKQIVWMIAKLVGNKNDFQDFSEMEENCFPQPKHDMQCWSLDINRIPYQRSISSFCHWTISIVCFLFVCLFFCLSGSHLFGSNSPLLWYQLMNVYRASCIHSRGLLSRAGKCSTSSSADKLQSIVFFCSLTLFLTPGT